MCYMLCCSMLISVCYCITDNNKKQEIDYDGKKCAEE